MPAKRLFSGLSVWLPGALVLIALAQGCDGASGKGASEGPKEQAPAEQNPKTVRLDQQAMEKSGIRVEPVRRESFRTNRDFPAVIELNRREVANITTLVRGRAVEVYADLGHEVHPGTVLAVLYSRELGDAQAALLKARATWFVTRRAYERAKVLLKEEIISLAEGQRREGDMIRAQAETRESYERLRLMGMTDAEIERLLRDQVIRSHVEITAPFHGFVIERNLAKGEILETTETPFVIADVSHMWIITDVPEVDIPFIPPMGSDRAKSVEVHVGSYPDSVFHGAITYIGNVVDPRTRTLRVRLEVPNPEFKLKAEMFAMVRMYSDPEDNVLVVPESAVQSRREERFVFVQSAPHTFQVRRVEVGESNGQVFKILTGLEEGEEVVTKNAFTLKSELFGDQV